MKGVVTLIGKQETYSNLISAYQIIKLWHTYFDSSFERVFFNTRSIKDRDVTAPSRLLTREVDRARNEAASPY